MISSLFSCYQDTIINKNMKVLRSNHILHKKVEDLISYMVDNNISLEIDESNFIIITDSKLNITTKLVDSDDFRPTFSFPPHFEHKLVLEE